MFGKAGRKTCQSLYLQPGNLALSLRRARTLSFHNQQSLFNGPTVQTTRQHTAILITGNGTDSTSGSLTLQNLNAFKLSPGSFAFFSPETRRVRHVHVRFELGQILQASTRRPALKTREHGVSWGQAANRPYTLHKNRKTDSFRSRLGK